MERRRFIKTALAGSVVPVTGCTGGGDDGNSEDADDTDTHPLDNAAIAFVGDYSRSEIKSELDATFDLYGIEQNEDNYQQASDSLVSIRQSSGVAEMTLLACIKEADLASTEEYDEGMDTFEDALVACAAQLD